MKKSFLSLLSLILCFTMLFTACAPTGVGGETDTTSSETLQNANADTESSAESVTETATETSAKTETATETATVTGTATETETITDTETETATETETETEEETVVITDVMIGETIEAEYAADFSVSRVFSDDMVVQRGEHIRVWGFAPESENGKKVSGEFKGMFAEALIENGEWCLTFGARLEADVNGAEMKIYADKKEVVFSGVLVGDVYMVIGQSNVEYSVSTHLEYTDAATQGGGINAIDPSSIIRLNCTNNASGGSFPQKGTAEVVKDLKNTKQWTKTTVNDTLPFSALGYYFAKEMVGKSNNTVPVGIIEIGFSGAPLGSFLPNEVAEALGTDTLDPETGAYQTTGVNAGKGSGRFIYNRHMAPFEKYAIAGLVWYQGESNNAVEEAIKFNTTFSALVEYMRGTHNVVNKEFPVIAIEIPSIYSRPSGYQGTWHYMELGKIRSCMGALPQYLDNCYLAVSVDIWSDKDFFNSLHPNCKFEQAGRAADIAEVVIFGNKVLDEATGPILESFEISEDKLSATLTFSNVGDGLKTLDGGNEIEGILVLLEKYPGFVTKPAAKATITGKDQITVTYTKPIKGVAYGSRSSDLYGETLNLCNSFGNPASAFMTPFVDQILSDPDYESFAPGNFCSTSDSKVGYKAQAIDTLKVSGTDYFPVGKITSGLKENNNTVTVKKGVASVAISGWIGFKYEILMFGYSLDGGYGIFKSYPNEPGDAVIAAGGDNAMRFTISINTLELEPGTHTVDYLALIEAKGRLLPVKILSFNLVVTE